MSDGLAHTPAGLMVDPDLPALKHWLIQKTGLSYYTEKDGDLCQALARSYHGRPPTAAAILHRLIAEAEGELDRIVESLTIGETFFFRHQEMFTALRDTVFPDILERRKNARHLRIWSAGCSVGAEPYSIAILLRDLLGPDFSLEIIGTDINRRFLQMAEQAEYDRWAFRGLPEETIRRCFSKVKTKWVLKDEYRKGVKFRSHNLVSDAFPSPPADIYSFDLIICRNVMIYFDVATIRRLADQFYRTLRPGGWLAVGHAEPHTDIFKEFHTINAPGAVLYQRASHASSPARSVVRELPSVDHPPDVRSLLAWTPAEIVLSPSVLSEPAAQKEDALASPAQADFEAVVEAARQKVRKDPLREEGHLLFALALLQASRTEEAVKALRKVIYLRNDLALAHYFLGLATLAMGGKAQRHFRNAREFLASRPENEAVPFGDGLTVGELLALMTALPTE